MASRVKIKVSTLQCKSSVVTGADERLKVSPATMRKEISANNIMVDAMMVNRASRRSPSDTHLAHDSFQCYRFSNLGLIWMLPLVLLVLVSSLSPVNGESRFSCITYDRRRWMRARV